MNRRGLTMIWAFAFAALMASGLASARMFFEEEGIEASTSDVRLPASSDGYIVIRACDGCDEVTLQLNDETRCIVNGQRLSYVDMQKLAMTPANSLNIFYNPDSREVTRLTLRGSFPVGAVPASTGQPQDAPKNPNRDHEVSEQ